MTKKELDNYLKSLCHEFHATVRFYKTKRSQRTAGQCDLQKRRIEIFVRPQDNMTMTASTVMHEICHIICHDIGKYPLFHQVKPVLNWNDAKGVLRTAYRAELYVDKMAEKLFKVCFPGMKYVKSYRTKEIKKFHAETYMKPLSKLYRKAFIH